MNYQSQKVSDRMTLKEALNAYYNDICYLTLKDGTNIEIIPEMGYMDNQLDYGQSQNEFVEEKLPDYSNNFNYNQVEQNSQGPLRGRGQNKKQLGKSLRKTVLKSLNGKGKEAKVQSQGKLRNVNALITFTESNDYIQCANCLKFFPSDEDNENEKTDNSSQQPQTPIKQQVQETPKKGQQLPKQQVNPQPQQKYPQNPKKVMLQDQINPNSNFTNKFQFIKTEDHNKKCHQGAVTLASLCLHNLEDRLFQYLEQEKKIHQMVKDIIYKIIIIKMQISLVKIIIIILLLPKSKEVLIKPILAIK